MAVIGKPGVGLAQIADVVIAAFRAHAALTNAEGIFNYGALAMRTGEGSSFETLAFLGPRWIKSYRAREFFR